MEDFNFNSDNNKDNNNNSLKHIKKPLKEKFINKLAELKNKNRIILYFFVISTLDLIDHLSECFLRLLLMCLPLSLYVFMLQMRDRPTPATNLFTFLNEKSTYQLISPGVILVAVNGSEYKDSMKKNKKFWENLKLKTIGILKVLAYISVIILTALVFNK